MKRWFATFVVLLAVVLTVSLAGQEADAAIWRGFKSASFLDMYLTPSFATDVLNYTLDLGANPQIVLSTGTFDINWIQGFYVVGGTPTTQFTATKGTVCRNWRWRPNTTTGQIAGWVGGCVVRMYAGDEKEFGFASLNIDGAPVLAGFQLGYQVDDVERVGYFKGSIPDAPPPLPCVPEFPTPLLGGLGAAFMGCVTAFRRRLQS